MGKLANSAKQSSGRNIFLPIKEGDKKRVRVLFAGPIKNPDGNLSTGTKGEPFGSWWHRIKENPAVGREYHEWLCIGKFRNCPLCFENDQFVTTKGGEVKNNEKPNPVRKKTYINVWSYEETKVLILAAGSDLWDKLTAIEEARGVDVDALDITIMRTGKGIRTEYQAVAGEASPFVLPEGNFLFDLEAETAVADRPKEDLDKVLSGEFDKQFASRNAPSVSGAGIDVSAALATPINFGQYAGKTLGQIAAIDLRYVQWLAQNSNDNNIAQASAAVLNQGQQQTPPPAQQQAPPVNAGSPPPPPPPPATPAPALPTGPSPFDMLAGGAKSVEQLRTEAITKASSDPKYRDPAQLKAKMMEAGGSLDLNSFTAQQLEKLLAIL